MLSDTLKNVEMIIKKREDKIFDGKETELLKFLENYRMNSWIYPGAIKRKLDVPIKEVYLLMEELEEQNIVESYYELVCGCCNKSVGTIIKTFNELPEKFYCDLCDQEVITIDNSVMVYKVIKE